MDTTDLNEARRLLDRESDLESAQQWAQTPSCWWDERPEVPSLHFIFRVGPQWVALPTSVFVEVHQTVPLRTLPFRSNAAFLGIANTKGSIHLVVGLESFLGITAPHRCADPDDSERMLEVFFKNDRFLVPASETLGNLPIFEKKLSPVRDHPFITHTLEVDGRTVCVLDTTAVFEAWKRLIK